jgi:hypothetical protein
MADHWKSLANLLGAPGVDEPDTEEAVTEPTPTKPLAEAKPEPVVAHREPEPKYEQVQEPAAENHVENSDSHDAFARFQPEEMDLSRDIRNNPNNPSPSSTMRASSLPAEDAEESPEPPKAVTSLPEPVAKPPKRKSSWESLASMFNIKVERAEVVEPAAAVEAAEVVRPPAQPKTVESKFSERKSSETAQDRSAQDRSAQRAESPRHETRKSETSGRPLSLFEGDAPQGDANPALEAMFADVPRGGKNAWDTKRRVVDDVSWQDDEDPRPPRQADVTSVRESVSDASDEPEREGAHDADEEMPTRRRRRRRGRRGRSEPGERRPEATSDRELGWVEADSEAFGGAEDDWSEPESFEADADILEVELAEVDDEEGGNSEESEDEVVERRSSRRRRRGRTRDRTPSEPMAERPPVREDRSARPIRGDIDDERFEDEDADPEAPSLAKPAVAKDRAPRGRRRRRGRSSGAGAEESTASIDRPARAERAERAVRSEREEAGPPADFDFEAGDDENGLSATKHRNIPTWADSLQSIIEANTDNHRRNDNRGGPRGRTRGRR